MKNVLLLSQDPMTHSLMRTVAGVAHFELSVAATWSQLLARLTMNANDGCVVVIGLDSLIEARRSASQAVAQIRAKLPTAAIALLAERKLLLDAHDREWARMCGADTIVARLSATRWMQTGDALLALIESDEATLARTRQRVTPYLRAAQQLESKDEAQRLVASIEAKGIDLAGLAKRLGRSGGVAIADRSYHLRSYSECFVASEAVDWIAKACSVARPDAVAIGRALQTCGLIYHVAREQSFDDQYFFFRVARLPENFVVADFCAQVNSSAGFEQRDRTYLGTEYKQCFVGKEAIAWCKARRMSANEAMSAGQRLLDLSIASHVVNEHPLKDEGFFYRFHAA